MKKTIFPVIVVLAMFSLVFAGGLVTNTNQSASFMRSLNRNASTDLDAAFFNPAGLTQLDNGLHIYLSNQSIYQTRTVEHPSALLNDEKYEGKTDAPLFPNAYFIMKSGKFAFAGGFAPIGGGGSATFENGLPSFELPIAMGIAGLKANNLATGYSLDMFFEGSSTYLGFQGTVSYQLNDAVSFAFGGRFVQATNTYTGHLKDINVVNGDVTLPMETVLDGIAAQYTAGSAQALAGSGLYAAGSAQAAAAAVVYTDSAAFFTGVATNLSGTAATLQNIADTQVAGSNPLTAIDTDGAIAAGLAAIGIDATGYTIDQAIAAYSGGAATMTGYASAYTAGAAQATALSAIYADSSEYYAGYAEELADEAENFSESADDVQDLEIKDVEETGTAFAPIFGINIKASDKINIGFKYEGVAKLELETKAKNADPRSPFQDGAKSNADMPGMFGAGISYQATPQLNIQTSFNYYFNSNANWDGRENETTGGWEAGVSAHYALTNSLELSGGFLTGDNGAFDSYNTDLSHSLNSNTVAAGFKMALGSRMFIEGGYANTMYEEGKNSADDETYMKTSNAFAIGIGLSL